jgi:hypothetical protein
MKIPTEKNKSKKSGLRVTHSAKSVKVNEYIYVLSNGQEITFKSKVFPIERPQELNNGQLLIF